MPIAKVKLPDGRIARLSVPEGTSEQEVMDYVSSNLSNQQKSPQKEITQQPEQPISRREALSRTSLQGATLGFGDELIGASKNIGNKAARGIENLVYGDNIIPETSYKQEVAQARNQLQQAREQYPVQSLVSEFISSLPTAGGILKTAGLAKATVPAAIGGGGLITGIATTGENEDLSKLPEELAVNVPVGAALGGVLQKVAPTAVEGVSSLAKRITSKFNGKSAGERLLEKNISPEAAKEGLETLKTNKELSTTGLDIDNPEFQSLAKRAVSNYPQAKQIAADFAAGRKDQALNRIQDALSKDVSPVDNAFKKVDDLIAERQQLSAPLYEKAYSENVGPIVAQGQMAKLGTLDELIGDDRIVNAIKTARKDYGIGKEIPDVSVPTLHGARQVIDDTISTARAAGENNKARSYTKLRNQINDVLYEASPTLKKADEVFADRSKLISATEEGMKFNKSSYQELAKKMAEMPIAEKDAYRIGARQAIQDTVEKATKDVGSSKPAEAVINKLYNKNQLKALFSGDEGKYQSFVKKLDQEVKYNQTIEKLGLNKADADKDTSRGIANLIGRIASFASTGSKPGIVFEGTRAAETALMKRYKGLNEKSAKDLMRVLINKEESKKALEGIVNNASKEQKSHLLDAINEIVPFRYSPQVGASMISTKGDLVSDANAEEPNMTENDIRKELLKRKKQDPILMEGINIEQEAKKIKKRFYRE